ncbi:MAG: methylaspartate mutase subunit E, partial [Verrucomicrobiota bacterium]
DRCDLLPATIDSYTRQNRYENAERGMLRSQETGKSELNGFPAVNYGIKGCRLLTESVRKPIEVRHGTPDARLLAEISLASGFTSFEGGGISYNIPYTKRIPLEESICNWSYVDRLVGLYEEQGIRINREPFGPLTGTLVPPFMSHAVAVLEGLLALSQGVKSISLGYGQSGCLVQDLAAMLSLREIAHKYFRSSGFEDYQLTDVFHQWMGGFPEDRAKALGVISWGSVVPALTKTTKVIVKTPAEALGVPLAEDNLQGLKTTRQIVDMLTEQAVPLTLELEEEKDLIERETESVLSRVLSMGYGSIAAGVVAAFKEGVLDVPFSPSICNRGRLIPVRDDDGAIRVLEWGNVPVDKECRDLHAEKISKRAAHEDRKPSFDMVTDDIYAISKGRLVGRPK